MRPSSFPRVLMGIFAYGISKVQTSVHLLKLFDPQAKILQDYEWMERELGKLVPMELVVSVEEKAQKEPFLEKQKAKHDIQVADAKERGEEAPDLNYDLLDYDLRYSLLERMELSHRIRTNLERYFGPSKLDIVGPGMSSDVFAPIEGLEQIHPGNSIGSRFTQRAIFEKQLAEKRDEMLEEDYLAVIGLSNQDPIEALADNTDLARAGREMWRISLRLAALNDVDYGDFVTKLKLVVEPIMKAYQYRTEILKTLHSKLLEDSLIKGRILILGPNPKRVGPDALAKKRITLDNVMETVDQTYIFSTTLRDLLENRGYTNLPKNDRPFRDKMYSWGDPTVIETMKKTSEEFVRDIRKFECVVLLEDHPVFDVDLIREKAHSFIDCRDHIFKIDPQTNLPASGMKTAMQRLKADEDVDIGTIYTGIIPIVYKAQNQLLVSLRNSIGLAFVMIAFVMMVLLRDWHEPIRAGNGLNISGGLISMLPNVFPIVIIFGAMGHMNIAVDIGSMMTASVAMGVAVDDTIHFLNWYRKGLAMGESRLDAIRTAYRRVATAMTQTTLIGGLGLSAFALSTFTPTQRFGVLMLFMLAAALIGDLILLPAILASPLGRFFGKVRKKTTEPNETEEEPHQIRVVSEFDDSEESEAHDDDYPADDDDYPDIHPDSLRNVRPPPGQDGSVG